MEHDNDTRTAKEKKRLKQCSGVYVTGVKNTASGYCGNNCQGIH